MRHARSLLAFSATLAAIALAPRAARAEPTIEVAYESSLPRVDAQGNQLAKRSLQLTPEGINRQDCLDDQRIRLTLLLAGYEANGHIEVWAAPSGIDCSSAPNRIGTTRGCWPVSDASVSLQPQVNVDIPVRRILSGAAPFDAAAPDASAASCGAVDLTNIAVQLLYFDPGALATASVNHVTTVAVDTIGPAPGPSDISLGRTDGKIEASWGQLNGGEGLVEISSVRMYCEDVEGIVDGGLCSGPALWPATGVNVFPDPAFEQQYACGALEDTTKPSITSNRLVLNGHTYAVALASVDKFGNVGPLSVEHPCAAPFTPRETEDGGCTTVAGPRRTGALSIAVVLGLVAVVARRRRVRTR